MVFGSKRPSHSSLPSLAMSAILASGDLAASTPCYCYATAPHLPLPWACLYRTGQQRALSQPLAASCCCCPTPHPGRVFSLCLNLSDSHHVKGASDCLLLANALAALPSQVSWRSSGCAHAGGPYSLLWERPARGRDKSHSNRLQASVC